MTEAAHQITCNPLAPGKQQPGTVGLPAGPEVAVVDDLGGPLPRGETGEIVIRGPAVVCGYESNPEANAEAFVNGWFRTGDQGRFDSDGYLVITGRLKEQINRGGEKISPLEIDKVVLTHPAVLETAAFGFPHPTLGEEVAAAVVLNPQTKATPAELQAFLGERLASFKIPRRFLILDEIPKGPTGKIQRRQLSKVLGLDWARLPHEPSEPLEQASALDRDLLDLWRRMLNLDSIELDDDFFESGGDSLLAMQMLVEFSKMIGREVPESMLFGHATVRQLARGVVDLDSTKATPTIHIHPEGGRPPLFFFHGDYTGRGFYTRRLARLLGPDQPFVSVAPHGLGRESIPHSFEHMAAERLPLILSTQHRDPYRLGGYCSGGMVALEVARLLIASGRCVDLVIMIDSPTLNLRPTVRMLHRGITKVMHILSDDPEEVLPWLASARDAVWRFLTRFERMSIASLTRHLAEARRKLHREVSVFFGAIGNSTSVGRVKVKSGATKLAEELKARDRELNRTYTRLFRHYFPRKIEVPIIYFSASYSGRPWRNVSPTVERVGVPGGHVGCITDDIEVLAEHLRHRLERLNMASPSNMASPPEVPKQSRDASAANCDLFQL